MIPPIPIWILRDNAELRKTTQVDPFQEAVYSVYKLTRIRMDMPSEGITVSVDGANKRFTGRLFYSIINSRITPTNNLLIEKSDTVMYKGKDFKVERVIEHKNLDGRTNYIEVMLV